MMHTRALIGLISKQKSNTNRSWKLMFLNLHFWLTEKKKSWKERKQGKSQVRESQKYSDPLKWKVMQDLYLKFLIVVFTYKVYVAHCLCTYVFSGRMNKKAPVVTHDEHIIKVSGYVQYKSSKKWKTDPKPKRKLAFQKSDNGKGRHKLRSVNKLITVVINKIIQNFISQTTKNSESIHILT